MELSLVKNYLHKNYMTYEYADGFKIRDQFATHFLTFTIVGWIDIFTRQCYRDLILESLKFCREKKGLQLGAYVIMSNHLHFIWTATSGNLSGMIRDFKGFTSKQITTTVTNQFESRQHWLLHMFEFYANQTAANEYFKVWSPGSHPEEIYSEKFCTCKLDYIHENPVRAGWVKKPEDYVYSSAADYQGSKGLIEIDFLY